MTHLSISLIYRAASAAAITLLLALTLAPTARAQEKPAAGGQGAKAEEEEIFPEFEALASREFRSVTLIAPVWRGLKAEGHYFGVEEVDVGTVGASWSFRLGRHVVLSPGLGVYFGERQKTSPALSFRWEIEKGWFFSQGLFIQSFEESEEFGRVSIWDGNHLSARWKRLEIGPSWERIHTREENEWKGGGRVALRIFPNVSAVVFVLGPKTEVRGGIIIHPAR